MKKATYVCDWTCVDDKDLKQAILVQVEEPIAFLGPKGPTESRYLAVFAYRSSAAPVPQRDRVRIYHAEVGRPLSTVLTEKHDTLSLREVMTEAGYDVSSWPKEIE